MWQNTLVTAFYRDFSNFTKNIRMTTTGLYSLSLKDYRTYLLSALFVAGNIILPRLAHLIPQGGFIFLPIYFFTLIAAYKYGIAAGLLTAVLSPLVNHWLFGMPPAEVLPVLLMKSSLLAIIAAFVAHRLKNVSIVNLIIVVLGYQLIGTFAEWAIVNDINAAVQDFRIGFPGMLLQVFAGYAVLKASSK